MIGRLERVPLREVWKHEALDFTQWLQENLDVLNEVVDLNFSTAEREQTAGAFSVDLVAEDDGGNAVIIENQLEKSDHDHLGKLILIPHFMHVDTVNAAGQHFYPEALEFSVFLSNCRDFCCSDKSEIPRVKT